MFGTPIVVCGYMKRLYLLFFIASCCFAMHAQDTIRITLDEAIALACKQSPQAVAANHQYNASYWNWRSFKANYLPNLSFTGNGTLNRTISSVTLPDGSDSFVHRNQLLSDGNLLVTQNVALTGGSFFVRSGLQRLDLFSENTISYNSTPVIIGYEQSLFGYNSLKWNKKTEPLRYHRAQKVYSETMELVSATAANKFFRLATAQSNYETAIFNYASADTLYRYAKGRYDIGTITENEMLQLEINQLTEQTNTLNASIDMDDCIQDLRSFLGIAKNAEIVVVLDNSIPEFTVSVEKALQLAHTNSPDIDWYRLQQLESESAVASAKAARGVKADLYLQFGLTQTDNTFSGSYRNPMDQQLVNLGIRIPILDWGVGKGRVRVAQSNLERVQTEITQTKTDFDANIVRLVKQFNLQAGKIEIAQKTAQRAMRRHEVAYKLYLLGKSTLLDLNAAISEKDSSKQAFVIALQNYWAMYYTLRSITGYDFEQDLPIAKMYGETR